MLSSHDSSSGGARLSEFDPAEIPAADPQETTDRFGPREVGDRSDVEVSDREGLPPRYRMRADEHYVEQLFGGERKESSAEAAGRRLHRTADPHVRPPQERQERVLVEIARDLTEIDTATGLLEGASSALTRRVGLDLIKARTWQALWLLRANAVLAGTHRGRVRRQPLHVVLAAVDRGLAAECRLAGVGLDVDESAASGEIAVDAEALAAGVAGAVIWTLNLVGDAEGAVIRLVGEVDEHGAGRIEVTQPDADLDGDRRTGGTSPEGWTADLAASVAKAVAKQHGGEAAFLVGDGRRSVVRLTLKS
jgi:hypothetical protein